MREESQSVTRHVAIVVESEALDSSAIENQIGLAADLTWTIDSSPPPDIPQRSSARHGWMVSQDGGFEDPLNELLAILRNRVVGHGAAIRGLVDSGLVTVTLELWWDWEREWEGESVAERWPIMALIDLGMMDWLASVGAGVAIGPRSSLA